MRTYIKGGFPPWRVLVDIRQTEGGYTRIAYPVDQLSDEEDVEGGVDCFCVWSLFSRHGSASFGFGCGIGTLAELLVLSDGQVPVVDGRVWGKEEVRAGQEEARDGREHDRDTHDLRLVGPTSEVSDEDDETDVSDTVTAHQEARLWTSKGEPSFNCPHHSVLVDIQHHPPENHEGTCSPRTMAGMASGPIHFHPLQQQQLVVGAFPSHHSTNMEQVLTLSDLHLRHDS